MAAELRPVLVTGGAGFIGSAFVRLLLSQGATVITLDALTYAGNMDNLESVMTAPGHRFVRGDIRDGGLLAGLLAETRPRAVVNLAAETHVDRSIDTPEAFIQTNLVGTATLLEEVRRYWQNRSEAERAAFRFVQVSTDEVYGSVMHGTASEEDAVRPNSPYAASKAGGDHLARAYHQTYGLPTLITHGCNTFGPRQFPEKLIPLHILNALDGEALPVYGDGSNQREWLYVEDHCKAVAAVLDRGRPGERYNIGSGQHLTTLQVVQSVCAVLDRLAPHRHGHPHDRSIVFVTDRPGHDFRYAVNWSKLERDTGWHPGTSFAYGLEQTVRWYLDQGDWCRSVTRARYDRRRLGTVR